MQNLKERTQYTIRFPHAAAAALREMSAAEDVSIAEVVRRAVRFYQVKIDATANNKRILLENTNGVREWVMI